MSSSATVRVEKATSDLLIGPDWTMNIEICDLINSQQWIAKDVVKAVKKRLQNKNPKVQLLALTLLETMIKNCGEYVHSQIAERNILQEMVKIVRKKTDMHVRDKILVLLVSWQEAFGGPGGKYPQYHWACEELRRSGVEFPKVSVDAAPIFTPPVTHSIPRLAQVGYGMPSNTSRRLDEAMAFETESLSSSNMDSMRSVMELLTDMLQAVNPNDREGVRDEVIVDLVSQCRLNQKKLMEMLNSTVDEELLGQGLALNDDLQSLLAKHDAIASGLSLPTEVRDSSPIPTEVRGSSSISAATPSTLITSVTRGQIEEEEEEDDDFAQLARRGTKTSLTPSQGTSSGESAASINTSESTNTPVSAGMTATPTNALSLPNPPTPVQVTTKEQDMIDLLSITLSTTSTSPHTPLTPPSSQNQNLNIVPVSPPTQGGYSYSPQPYPGNHAQVPFNSYVAPWAQPQPQPQFSHYSSNYPPPPWAAPPAVSDQIPFSTNPYMPTQNSRPLQHYNSFPSRTSNGSIPGHGETLTNPTRGQALPPGNAQKPFVPSYRLFEDLNVFGTKTTNSSSHSMAGNSGQGMVGGRK